MLPTPRYLIPFDLKRIPVTESDFLIIGSGIAGLYAAIKAADRGRVAVITKDRLERGSTRVAQGGIAAALQPPDSPEQHMQDTLVAGAGLCDREAVSVLVHEGPECVRELMEMGARFDTHNGELALAREGAHGQHRIVRAGGDATGFEVARALTDQAHRRNIAVHEYALATDLICCEGRCVGAVAVDGETGRVHAYRAAATLVCTGGAGQLFSVTTNPDVVTGDGMALAYRAGAELADLEFVQFHPTAFAVPLQPRFLISEAVRGEGAILRHADGYRFMPDYDDRAELAPRDVVTRAILTEMRKRNTNQVFLDLTNHSEAEIRRRFPRIYQTCLEHGVNPAHEGIPVYPAAHYYMGGVRTSVDAETTVPNLYAAGEVASVGVHGGNRLASNSLLEGLVFARRAVESATERLSTKAPWPDEQWQPPVCEHTEDVGLMKMSLQRELWEHAGILRDAPGLQHVLDNIDAWELALMPRPERSALELANMVTLAQLLALSALHREESRGGHYRMDFPDTDDERWRVHTTIAGVADPDEPLSLRPQLSTVPVFDDD